MNCQPKITFRGESELTTRVWQTEQKKIRVTAAFSLEDQQGKREPTLHSECQSETQRAEWTCRTGQTAVWALCKLLLCGSVHLVSRSSNTKSISADEWDAREQREVGSEQLYGREQNNCCTGPETDDKDSE